MRELAITVLIGLASYRAWAFLALDTITVRLRALLFFRDPLAGDFRRLGRVGYYYWMCPWCLGAWITAGITIVTNATIDGGVGAPLLVFGAAAALTALIGERDSRLMETD